MDGGWRGRDRGDRAGRVAFGVLLILVGLGLFASQQLHIDFGEHAWPLFIIVPGLVLLLAGLAIPSEAGLGSAIPGGIVTAVGLLLWFQDTTGAWASWAYAWALVAPGSVGLAMALFGLVHRRGDLIDAGVRTLTVGLGLFVAFGLFFETVLGLDREEGITGRENLFPILPVVAGALLVLGSLHSSRGRASRDEWKPADPANWTAGTSDHGETQPKP
jgi:hypothetical protein